MGMALAPPRFVAESALALALQTSVVRQDPDSLVALLRPALAQATVEQVRAEQFCWWESPFAALFEVLWRLGPVVHDGGPWSNGPLNHLVPRLKDEDRVPAALRVAYGCEPLHWVEFDAQRPAMVLTLLDLMGPSLDVHEADESGAVVIESVIGPRDDAVFERLLGMTDLARLVPRRDGSSLLSDAIEKGSLRMVERLLATPTFAALDANDAPAGSLLLHSSLVREDPQEQAQVLRALLARMPTDVVWYTGTMGDEETWLETALRNRPKGAWPLVLQHGHGPYQPDGSPQPGLLRAVFEAVRNEDWGLAHTLLSVLTVKDVRSWWEHHRNHVWQTTDEAKALYNRLLKHESNALVNVITESWTNDDSNLPRARL